MQPAYPAELRARATFYVSLSLYLYMRRWVIVGLILIIAFSSGCITGNLAAPEYPDDFTNDSSELSDDLSVEPAPAQTTVSPSPSIPTPPPPSSPPPPPSLPSSSPSTFLPFASPTPSSHP